MAGRPSISGEAGGSFDRERAPQLWGGGDEEAASEAGGFNAVEAVRIGVAPDMETAVAGRIDDTVR